MVPPCLQDTTSRKGEELRQLSQGSARCYGNDGRPIDSERGEICVTYPKSNGWRCQQSDDDDSISIRTRGDTTNNESEAEEDEHKDGEDDNVVSGESTAVLLTPSKESQFMPGETINIYESGVKVPLMGHGLILYRQQLPLDSCVKDILEELFMRGVTQASNRKGILEMLEECNMRLPALMVPKFKRVNTWLSGRITKEKSKGSKNAAKAQSERTGAGTGTDVNKSSAHINSESTKRQRDARKLSREEYQSRSDASMEHLFLAKYSGIFLVKDDEVRIISGVTFTGGMWCVQTTKTRRHPFENKIFVQDIEDNGDTIDMQVKRGKESLGAFIEAFNGSYKGFSLY